MEETKGVKQSRTSLSGVPNRQDQASLARGVGVRMREAREMVGLSQLNAARQLGYANSSKLAKIEGGKDSSQIPLWVIKRASCLYDVSVDYLLGNTETMEAEDARHAALREMMVHMREHWERLRERDVIVQQGLLERFIVIEQLVTLLDCEAAEAAAAMARFVELNPGWLDMRGGSRLVDAVERTSAAARTARTRLNRHRRESKAAGGVPQLDLVFA